MEMAMEAAAVMPHPKIMEAIEDLHERIGVPDPALHSVTIIALVGDPNDAPEAAFGIDQGDTPVQLRLLTQAATGQDPALPWDERAPALRGPIGGRPVDLAIQERRRRRPDLTS